MQERPSTLLAVVALVLAVGSGLYGTIFWLRHDPGPGEARVFAAADWLRARYQPGDLIFLLPTYATRARERLGDLPGVLAVQAPEAEDLEIRSRVWVFSMFGAGADAGHRLEHAGFSKTLDEEPAAGIRVALFERAPSYAVTYDFMEQMETAKVWHQIGDRREACAARQGTNGQGGAAVRWGCQRDKDWFYVSPEYHRMGEHTRRCLWAHPPNDGALVVSFPNVPLDSVLTVRAGHTQNSSVRARAPVFLDVAIGSDPVQRFAFDLEDTWTPQRLSIQTATTATVTFTVSSPDAGLNHFCFAPDVRRPVTP